MNNRYIAYRPLNRKCLGGRVNIKRGDVLKQDKGVLFYKNVAVCVWNCQVAKEYFAPDDDNNGLRRGDIIYAIAFKEPLTELQKDIVLATPSINRFLRKDNRTILFNDDFFSASVMELMDIAWKLGIKV